MSYLTELSLFPPPDFRRKIFGRFEIKMNDGIFRRRPGFGFTPFIRCARCVNVAPFARNVSRNERNENRNGRNVSCWIRKMINSRVGLLIMAAINTGAASYDLITGYSTCHSEGATYCNHCSLIAEKTMFFQYEIEKLATEESPV
jgi:hypothetical protein